MTSEIGTQQALHSLLGLYQELASTVKSEKLAQIGTSSAIAQKVAKSLALTQEISQTPERTHGSLHLEKKRLFFGLWDAVTRFFGREPKKEYSFIKNFQAIKEQFAAIDIAVLKQSVKSPEELQLDLEHLEKLKNVMNALALREEKSGKGNYEKISRSISTELQISDECHAYVKKGETLLQRMDNLMAEMQKHKASTAPYRQANGELRKLLQECASGFTDKERWQTIRQRLDQTISQVEPMIARMPKPKPTRAPPPIPQKNIAPEQAAKKVVMPSFDKRPPPLETKPRTPPTPPPRTDSLKQLPLPEEAKKVLFLLLRDVNNPDVELLEALLSTLEVTSGMHWDRMFKQHSKLFEAFPEAGDRLTIAQLCEEIRSIRKSGNGIEKLDAIVAALEVHPAFSDALQATLSRKKLLQSEEFIFLKQLVAKSEAQKTAAEKQLMLMPCVKKLLQQLGAKVPPQQSEVVLLCNCFGQIETLMQALHEAKIAVDQAKAYPELAKVLSSLGSLPKELQGQTFPTIEDLHAYFQKVKDKVEQIKLLKTAVGDIATLNTTLAELQAKEQAMQNDAFFGQFCQKIMPSALPFMREIGSRVLFQDPYKHPDVTALPYSTLENLESWLESQKQVIKAYNSGLTELYALKVAIDERLTAKQRQTLFEQGMPQESIMPALIGSQEEWKGHCAHFASPQALQSSEYKAFNASGYASMLSRAQDDLQQLLPEVSVYYLDRYAEAIANIAQGFRQMMSEYKKVWDNLVATQHEKATFIEQKKIFAQFAEQENGCREKLLAILAKLASSKTEKIMALQQKFSAYIQRVPQLEKRAEFEALMGRSLLVNPPRMSPVSEKIGQKNDAYGPLQESLMKKLDETCKKQESVDMTSALARNIALHKEKPNQVDESNEDDWK